MENAYSTLRILYQLSENSHQPTHYGCRPVEIIARHDQPWDAILIHLERLAAENLILFSSPVSITITEEGLSKVRSMNHSKELAEISKKVA